MVLAAVSRGRSPSCPKGAVDRGKLDVLIASVFTAVRGVVERMQSTGVARDQLTVVATRIVSLQGRAGENTCHG